VRIFVFEFATGGGLLAAPDFAQLAREGGAMVAALAADFARGADRDVVILREPRCQIAAPESVQVRVVTSAHAALAAFDQEAATADLTVVIAPETDGILQHYAERVTRAGGTLLSPDVATIQLASDKQATAEHLAAAGIAVPRGRPLPAPGSWPFELAFPEVLKRRDGAGSQGMRLLTAPLDAAQWPADWQRWRLEEFHAGIPASVSVLCGPAACVPLPPCVQLLSDDGYFQYRGGRLPLSVDLAARATELARRAIATLPNPRGYVGVDLVLGSNSNGADDVVIEINPRLTTSFIGLRAATTDNLAEAMLAVATGRSATLSFAAEPVEFSVDGEVSRRA